MDQRAAILLGIGVAAIGATLLSRGAKVAPTTPTPVATTDSAILLIGDSLAVGLGPHLKKTFPRLSNHSEVGSIVHDWTFRSWPGSDLALVSLGTNDCAGQDPAGYLRGAQQLLLDLGKSVSKVVWLLPPPMPARISAPCLSSITEIVETLEAPANLPRAPDAIHLPPTGYAAWAKSISARLLGEA
jgi:lysophospholipase L1-like esterase